MLLFRSEDHVASWCNRWNLPQGETLTLEQLWGLARAWYEPDRRDPEWRRFTAQEARAIFEHIGRAHV